jgi:6-phosphogluconate dehydrogenase
MISAQVSALQRDYFGAHGYFKLEGLGSPAVMTTKEGEIREFHTEWMLDKRPETEVTG